MKLLVFSDIHGSLPVAECVLDLASRHDPEVILVLGDVLYHGPRNPLPVGYSPKSVAEALAPLAPRIIAVRGNCDSDVDAMVLPFSFAEPFTWVLQEKAGTVLRIFATHGHIFGPHNMPPLLDGDVLLYGHTHVPKAEKNAGGIRICNPGSLALPKEGHPPCYGIFENGLFSVLTKNDDLYLQLDCKQDSPKTA